MVSQDEDTSATATAAGQSFSGATARRAAADKRSLGRACARAEGQSHAYLNGTVPSGGVQPRMGELC